MQRVWAKMKVAKIKYPTSYDGWAKGRKGFEVKDSGSNRICSDVTQDLAQRIALCLNYCHSMSNDELTIALPDRSK